MPGLSFTDAYFETVAALTTTGSTVLSGLDKLPPSINLWRCELQWLGGMGIIVLAVAILPLLGIGGSQIMRTETPGPMKDTKLTPRITETAKGLWLVYALMTLACALVFKAVGMGWFDAVVHSFSTLSLEGSLPTTRASVTSIPGDRGCGDFLHACRRHQFRNSLPRVPQAEPGALPERPRGGCIRRADHDVGARNRLFPVRQPGLSVFLDGATPQRLQRRLGRDDSWF